MNVQPLTTGQSEQAKPYILKSLPQVLEQSAEFVTINRHSVHIIRDAGIEVIEPDNGYLWRRVNSPVADSIFRTTRNGRQASAW